MCRGGGGVGGPLAGQCIGPTCVSKGGEAATEAHLRCSWLRQSYFWTGERPTPLSRLLHPQLQLWWGNHTVAAQAPPPRRYRHDQRMDSLFTWPVRGTGALVREVLVGHGGSLLLSSELLEQAKTHIASWANFFFFFYFSI